MTADTSNLVILRPERLKAAFSVGRHFNSTSFQLNGTIYHTRLWGRFPGHMKICRVFYSRSWNICNVLVKSL